MKLSVEIDSLYPNKTQLYVAPCIVDWGNEFLININPIVDDILAIGINDFKFYKFVDSCIFLLVRPSGILQTVLEYLREHESYQHDYARGNNHMIVIKLPDKHKDIIPKFVVGKYSQMYSKEDVDNIFPKIKRNENGIQIQNYIYRVLTYDKSYIPLFQQEIKRKYNTTVTAPMSEIRELDFPPDIEEETFGFEKYY